MKKINILFASLLFIFLISAVVYAKESGEKENIYYFTRPGCLHCANVIESGVLEKVSLIDGVIVSKYDVSLSQEGRDLYNKFSNGFKIPQNERGIPFVVIEKNREYSYLSGDNQIINKLEDDIINFKSMRFDDSDLDVNQITLWSLIVAALIDSVNPCAFGVLIFLMLSLLKIGSHTRALKAGLIYTFVVFSVYFLAGFGIFKAIQIFTSVTHIIHLTAGVLVLTLGLWQFKDILFPNFGPSLAISPKAKPLIERIIHKGTLPAIILLGIVVSLFELPCTGGIYLGILTMMSIHKTFAISYLLLYNAIFVLPLIIITLLVYRGTSPEILQRWTSRERTWMKLFAGIVLVGLGIYILLF